MTLAEVNLLKVKLQLQGFECPPGFRCPPDNLHSFIFRSSKGGCLLLKLPPMGRHVILITFF